MKTIGKTLKKFNDVLSHYDTMIEFIDKQEISNRTKKNIKTYYTNAIILKLKEIKKQDVNIYIQKIKERKMIKNIQVTNLKQLIKKLILRTNIKC